MRCHGNFPDAGDDEPIQHHHRHHADNPDLLGETGGDEVALIHGRQPRRTLSPAAPEQPTPGVTELGLDDLVIGVVVVERIQPGIDPSRHVAGEPPGEQPRDHERDTREDRPGRALRRDVDHEGEQTEEQQGGAKVVLENHDAQREEPHHHDGTQIAGSGELEPEDASAGQRQQVAFLVEIGREGQGQEDLGHLGGLKTERAEPNPDSRTVEFATDPRHERQQQQHHACQEQQVGETLEPAVIAQPDHDSGEQQDTEPRPEQLVRSGMRVLGVVEAGDHGQAEAVEQEHDR